MASFSGDLEAGLPTWRRRGARKYLRTTTLSERRFVEEHPRTMIIPRFFNERSGWKLVFAVLWRASERWQRVRMSEGERRPREVLRAWLSLTHEPGSVRQAVRPNREAVHEAEAPRPNAFYSAFYRKIRT
ncbi:MAG: hypothetical protein D6704_03055 [Nitrospirae bacterium]|nr:MAG: hypothetical protein D6704_03055 [Nitrospirota bacterium]